MNGRRLQREALCLLLLGLLSLLSLPARAQGDSLLTSRGGARTLPKGRVELALFQLSRYGLHERVELATQPLMLLMPQLEVKVHGWSYGALHLGGRLRLAYPTPLLNTLAREGAGGLLPPKTNIPTALLVELECIASYEFALGHEITASLGLAAAPRGSYRRVPVLDFPFLYARFAPLWTAATQRLALRYDGTLHRYLGAGAGLRYFRLPVVDGGFSVEAWAAITGRLGRHFGVELGLIAEHSRYPAGLQTHLLPYLDLAFAFH